MPRRSVAEARQTREAIVERAVALASSQGLEGVTIGRLAEELGLSKAGILNHFPSKEALQLAAVLAARDRFAVQVGGQVEGLEPGLDRLLAVCDAWITHVARTSYPGGCFWAAASAEFDGRPGEVRNAVVDIQLEWKAVLTAELRAAVAAGELPQNTDVAQVIFELRAIALGLNQDLQLHGDRKAERHARRAVRRALGRPDLPIRRPRVPIALGSR